MVGVTEEFLEIACGVVTEEVSIVHATCVCAWHTLLVVAASVAPGTAAAPEKARKKLENTCGRDAAIVALNLGWLASHPKRAALLLPCMHVCRRRALR